MTPTRADLPSGRPRHRYERTSLANREMQLDRRPVSAWAMHLSNRVNTLVLRAAQVPTRTLRVIARMSARMLQIRPAMAWPDVGRARGFPAGECDDRDDEAHQPA